MELKKLPHIEIEVAPLPGKKLPAAVNTLRKLDVKKVGLIAGGTAAVLTVVSVAGRYGISVSYTHLDVYKRQAWGRRWPRCPASPAPA